MRMLLRHELQKFDTRECFTAAESNGPGRYHGLSGANLMDSPYFLLEMQIK